MLLALDSWLLRGIEVLRIRNKDDYENNAVAKHVKGRLAQG
jgi:hypothetical protein